MGAGPAGGVTVGVDVGGTKVHAVLLGDDGAVLAQARGVTEHGPDGVARSVEATVRSLTTLEGVGAERAGVPGAGLVGVGVALPGVVADGSVSHAVNLGLVEPVPLASLLGDRLGTPVHLANDLNAAAVGAAHLMGLGGDVAFLALGTGVAAGLVLDGRLRSGHRHAAGEIGHLPYRPDGPRCPCGQRGCLELYASGASLDRAWAGRGGRGPGPAEVFAADVAGDPYAARLRRDFVDAVAAAVRILVLTCDVEHVVLGGGVAGLGTQLLDAVVRATRAQAAGVPLLEHLDLGGRVRLVDRSLPVAPVGAALLAEAAGVPAGEDR